MIEKRFFLSNLLKNFLVLHLPSLKVQKEHFLCKTIPKKTEKIDIFKYSRRYGIYSKDILMQVIYSFVIINLNKNEHFCAIESFWS